MYNWYPRVWCPILPACRNGQRNLRRTLVCGNLHGRPTQIAKRVKRADSDVLALDIESIKGLLKFPDRLIDQLWWFYAWLPHHQQRHHQRGHVWFRVIRRFSICSQINTLLRSPGKRSISYIREAKGCGNIQERRNWFPLPWCSCQSQWDWHVSRNWIRISRNWIRKGSRGWATMWHIWIVSVESSAILTHRKEVRVWKRLRQQSWYIIL